MKRSHDDMAVDGGEEPSDDSVIITGSRPPIANKRPRQSCVRGPEFEPQSLSNATGTIIVRYPIINGVINFAKATRGFYPLTGSIPIPVMKPDARMNAVIQRECNYYKQVQSTIQSLKSAASKPISTLTPITITISTPKPPSPPSSSLASSEYDSDYRTSITKQFHGQSVAKLSRSNRRLPTAMVAIPAEDSDVISTGTSSVASSTTSFTAFVPRPDTFQVTSVKNIL